MDVLSKERVLGEAAFKLNRWRMTGVQCVMLGLLKIIIGQTPGRCQGLQSDLYPSQWK